MGVGRAAVARLAVPGLVVMGALFAAPPAWAAPNPPSPTWDTVYADYYSYPWERGDKDLGTTIELTMEDGRQPPCSNGTNPLSTDWDCSISPDYFWPRPDPADDDEIIEVRAVDALGQKSAPATFTVVLAESRLSITTPHELPSGDTITLEGQREFGATIQWELENLDSGLVFQNRQCAIPEDVEDQSFSCEYDTRPARSRAAAVPDGDYEATFTEFQGATIIDQISFLFTVGGGTPPATPTPTPSADPTLSPPNPTDPPTQPPTDPPGGGSGGGGGVGGTTTPPTPTSGPSPTAGTPSPSATPTPTPTASASPTPVTTPVEPDDQVAAPPAAVPDVDILPWLVLAVMAFTVLGTIGMPGLGLGGRFAPGSTRTGGGQLPVGRWPSADVAAAGLHRSVTATLGTGGSAGLIGLAAGEVGTADEAVEVHSGAGTGWGDRSMTWRAPGHELTDELGATLPLRLAPRWPLFARLVDDGTPVRAILGSLSLLLPLAGLVLGAVGGLRADGPFAPTLAVSVVLLAIGLTDAIAGIAAVVGFAAAVVLTSSLTPGDITVGQGLRGLVGVAALWFVVPLVAGAARPFRRLRAPGQVYAWDRVADALIAALLSGWAVQGLVGSLDDLVGHAQPLTRHADLMGVLTVVLVVARFGVEELAARAYPRRLATVHSEQPPGEPSSLVQLRGVVVRSGFLAFFAWAFIGSCWELWVGVAIFALPYVLALVHQRIPDARTLAITVPRGVVETLVLVVVGAALAYWLDANAGDDATGALRTGFVILAIPASMIGVVGVLGGEPPAQRWTWPRQLSGALVVVLTVAVVLIWL